MKIGIDLAGTCYNGPREIGIFERNVNDGFLQNNVVYVFGGCERSKWIPS